MQKHIPSLLTAALLLLGTFTVFAGNPDRQGEAGAQQLLMNPWAQSAGLHTLNTASITGAQALRLNVAGVARIVGTQVSVGHALYMRGTDISMSGLGIAQRIGENGAIGISVMALDFGDINVTTVGSPEGTGATYSPNFFNLGIGYSHIFENKVSVGVTLRAVSESISDVAASAVAIDAGVQYVTGDNDEFQFGISLRNIGSQMIYEGDGLTFTQNIEREGTTFPLTVEQRSEDFELQSVLNIGLAYDVLHEGNGGKNKLTLMGNFTSNAFSRDQIGAAAEYTFNRMFTLRAGYRYTLGVDPDDITGEELYNGIAGGFSVQVPFNKDEPNGSKFAIDYGYRATSIYDGTHNIGLRIDLPRKQLD